MGRKSLIFRIMEFASEREDQGKTFTGQELCDEVGKDWTDLESYATRIWKEDGSTVIEKGIFEPDRGGGLGTGVWSSSRAQLLAGSYRITHDAKMHYLDYLELEEARAASRQAQSNATIAIWIAIGTFAVSAILSVYFGLRTSEVRLEAEQYKELLSVIDARSRGDFFPNESVSVSPAEGRLAVTLTLASVLAMSIVPAAVLVDRFGSRG